jgi:hypothetical protein
MSPAQADYLRAIERFNAVLPTLPPAARDAAAAFARLVNDRERQITAAFARMDAAGDQLVAEFKALQFDLEATRRERDEDRAEVADATKECARLARKCRRLRRRLRQGRDHE